MIGFGRRRRFLIDRLQLKLLGVHLAYLGMVIFLFLVAVFTPVILALHAGGTFEQEAGAAEEFLNLHERIWPAVPLALLLVSLHSFIVSHRIAGPLYRFRKVFGAIESGDLAVRCFVRKRDYLHRESDSINDMIGGLGARVAPLLQGVRDLRALHSELERAAEFDHRALLVETLARLDERLAQLETHEARIRLPEAVDRAGPEAETPTEPAPAPARAEAVPHHRKS